MQLITFACQADALTTVADQETVDRVLHIGLNEGSESLVTTACWAGALGTGNINNITLRNVLKLGLQKASATLVNLACVAGALDSDAGQKSVSSVFQLGLDEGHPLLVRLACKPRCIRKRSGRRHACWYVAAGYPECFNGPGHASMRGWSTETRPLDEAT